MRGCARPEELSMAVSGDYLQYVLEQLAGLGALTKRRMFGAVGLYSEALFFAIISDDTLYMKVNDANRGEYQARRMSPFRPYADKPHLSMGYFELPADILEDAEECVLWARKSVAAANLRTPPARRRKAGK
jgi:DNA transformation protein and related proteins